MAITAARVLEILEAYGVDAVFRTYTSTDYDPTQGSVTLGAETDYTHKVIPPYAPGHAEMARWVGDGIQGASALTAVSASGLSFTPAVGMELLYDRKTWRITGVSPVRYKGDVVLYELALGGKAA